MKETEPHMLTRTDDPWTSHAAGESIDVTKIEAEVLNLIILSQSCGVTAYECICYFNPISNSTINARPSALERKGLIYYDGDTRNGGSGKQQRVMRANRRKVHIPVSFERRQPMMNSSPDTIHSLKKRIEKLEQQMSEIKYEHSSLRS